MRTLCICKYRNAPLLYNEQQSSMQTHINLTTATMANFSVECLAKSYYEEVTHTKDAALPSKHLSEIEKFTKELRSQCSSSSPNSKFTDRLCFIKGCHRRDFVCVLLLIKLTTFLLFFPLSRQLWQLFWVWERSGRWQRRGSDPAEEVEDQVYVRAN